MEPAEIQDDGVDFNGIHVFRTFIQSHRHVVARARPQHQNLTRRVSQKAIRPVISLQDDIRIHLSSALELKGVLVQ
jgi:hypothetical protein